MSRSRADATHAEPRFRSGWRERRRHPSGQHRLRHHGASRPDARRQRERMGPRRVQRGRHCDRGRLTAGQVSITWLARLAISPQDDADHHQRSSGQRRHTRRAPRRSAPKTKTVRTEVRRCRRLAKPGSGRTADESKVSRHPDLDQSRTGPNIGCSFRKTVRQAWRTGE